MTAKDWVMANKIKTAASLVVSLVAVILLPISFVAWAEDLSAQQVKESEIRQEAKASVIHSDLRAMHNLDEAKRNVADAEDDMIYLEEQVVAGMPLTPTQDRKYLKLQKDLEKYEDDIEEAEEQLANPE